MIQEGATGARILIVEDNVDSAETMQMLLAIAGHEARTAYDGASALEVAREFSPEVVLCDIGLPGKDGYAVARELRELDLAVVHVADDLRAPVLGEAREGGGSVFGFDLPAP